MKRKLGLLIIVSLLLVGCSGLERVTTPPVVTVGGGNTIAVLFFDNFTDDYAIPHEVEQELVKTLSEYYRVLDPQEVEWALVRLGLMRGQSPDRNQAVRLGEMLGVDALVVGEVSGYFAPITQTPPYLTGHTQVDRDGSTLQQYEYLENTQVMISFTGRVMDTRAGNVIHRLRVEGQGTHDYKETIRFPREWWPENRGPSTWDVPRPSHSNVAHTRQTALRQAVNEFIAELMPTYHWRRAN